MTKKKVAIIGAGVVGSSAAYFLSKQEHIDVTIFDEGTGQGTAASAGIISPWLSRRRNKKWYRMVKDSAAFYPYFLKQVMGEEAIPTSVYSKVGTLLFKHNPDYLREMLEIGYEKRKEAPEIGELSILSPEEIRKKFPLYTGESSAVWVSGGARVDGKELVDLLLNKAQDQSAQLIKEKAKLFKKDEHYLVETETRSECFDAVILSSSAWLPEILQPLGYAVDIRPQKGQLVELKLENVHTNHWPVIMPEGEKDIIPFNNGTIVIGATHQNDAGFDLTIEEHLLEPMISETISEFSKYFYKAKITHYRSGTRAFTSDHSPFFGEIPRAKGLFAASGLGSTGLTAGPLIGKVLSQLVLNQKPDLPPADYPIEQYIAYQENKIV